MCKTQFFLLLLSVKRYYNIPTQLPFLRILCIGPTDTSTVWCEPISGMGRTRQWCFSTSLSPWVWWQYTQPGSQQVWQRYSISTNLCCISISWCRLWLNWFGSSCILIMMPICSRSIVFVNTFKNNPRDPVEITLLTLCGYACVFVWFDNY